MANTESTNETPGESVTQDTQPDQGAVVTSYWIPGYLEHADHGDQHHINVCGTATHLKKCGVDIEHIPKDTEFDTRQTVVGEDGHTWEVWGKDWFGMTARRPRTDAERVAWIDSANSRLVSGNFSTDREMMCLEIAMELQEMAACMAPDKPVSRRVRRGLKRKLNVLAGVQMALVNRKVDMQSLRTRLLDAGLVVHQHPYRY